MRRGSKRNIETIRREGKVVGYRHREMVDGKIETGPQRRTILDAHAAFERQTEWAKSLPDPDQPTLSTLVEGLLEGRLKREWRPKTLGLAKTVAKRLENGLGELPLSQITPTRIVEERLRWPVAASSAHRYQRMLERLLGLLGKPLKAEKPRKREPVIRILTQAEQKDFLKRIVQPRTRLAAEILLGWGLRAGEACGLMHEDRHEDGVFLRRAIGDDGKAYPMKTDQSRAWIPFTDDELEKQIGPPRKGYVLATSNGTPMLPANLRRMIQSVAEGTPYEGLRPQDLRHTAAVNLLRSGNDPGTVASITRHSVDTLLKIYYRAIPEAKIEAMEKLRKFRQTA